MNPVSTADLIRWMLNFAVEITGARMFRLNVRDSMESISGRLSSCRSLLYERGKPFSMTSMFTNVPMTEPVLPLISSVMSGFFFWGMMEEPVVYLSSISTKPNSWEDQYTSSSEMDDRCTAHWDAQNAISVTKSLSLTESMEFSVGPENPRASAVIFLSMGYVVPARAAEPRGHLFILLKASMKRSASRASLNACAR